MSLSDIHSNANLIAKEMVTVHVQLRTTNVEYKNHHSKLLCTYLL